MTLIVFAPLGILVAVVLRAVFSDGNTKGWRL